MIDPIVIIGTGLAGYSVARELRKLDATVPVLMVSADGGDYYAKPTLSNALAQQRSAEQLVTTSAQAMASQLQLELRSRVVVTGLDPVHKQVLTADGSIRYSRLVLALGADPIRLPMAGDGVADVLSVNDLDDYRRLRERLDRHPAMAGEPAAGGCRVLVIGAGLIGCEFANDLLGAGHQVSVVDPAAGPIAALLPSTASEALRRALASQGVGWLFGDVVLRVDKEGSAYSVLLRSGICLQVDLVLSAVGLKPRTALAALAGLAVGRGIQVDSQLRSSYPDIFALGDCAEIDGQWRPYVMPILPAARALAATLTGKPRAVTFGPMPVLVKTPGLPVVVLPVARDAAGRWSTEQSGNDMKSVFTDLDGQVTGFALTGARTPERARLVAQLAVAGA